MLRESKKLIENFDKYFLRKYHWRYHLLIVDNHLFHCYGFFLQAQKSDERLIHSYDLLEMPHDKELYQQVLVDLRSHTELSIEFRDTHHLVHPGKDIVRDLMHGHIRNTKYKQNENNHLD